LNDRIVADPDEEQWYDPEACPTCARSRFWLQSQFAKFIFRPRQHILDLVKDTQKRLEWPLNLETITLPNASRIRVSLDQALIVARDESLINTITPYRVIGAHVRRTDKVSGDKPEAKAQMIESYLEIIQKWNPNDVFFATDSPSTASEIRLKAPKFLSNSTHIMIDIDQERLELGSGYMANHDIPFNQTLEAINTIKDIWLLKQTDVFVCTISSFFARLVVRLRFADNRLHGQTWFSLDDDPWGNWPFTFSYLQ